MSLDYTPEYEPNSPSVACEGCKDVTKTKCVIFEGDNLDETSIVTGDTLLQIIQKLNSKISALEARIVVLETP